MANYELIVKNFGELTNKALVKELKAIDVLQSKTEGNKWKQAEHYRNILEGSLYEDDFNSLSEFAKVIGASKQQVSQMVTALNYADECGVNKDDWTISKVYILYLIKDVEDFMKWLTEKHPELNITVKEDLRFYSDSFIKELRKEYEGKNKPAQIEDKEIESEDVTPEKEVEDTHDPIKVEFDGMVAYIPYSVALQYVVEE